MHAGHRAYKKVDQRNHPGDFRVVTTKYSRDPWQRFDSLTKSSRDPWQRFVVTTKSSRDPWQRFVVTTK